ncbi:DUF4268 domain-containing protein [Nocardioides sp.]|uniref:DUF4268 domain-containing protein n=1 Tax=Nocardioides sp. TaxID=35761 RepID=UPI00260F1C2A|nr:DUF4268 domain-containing protein [Nocardioides sp.]
MESETQGLGRLTPISIREVWKHEAHDFTLWLLENADVLGDALGMDLELTEAERRVGGFALDLIGTDLSTNATVIVENQLEQTDHSHLGQLLTYAGGTDPSTIVWCAPTFREEHRAALDWLNEHTDEDTRFFGVEIAAVRIDSSRPAPLFKIVAKPNDWTKQLHTERTAVTLSPKALAYQAFWQDLLSIIRTQHPTWTRSTAGSNQSWITLPFGTSTIWYGMTFTNAGPRVELYFGSSDGDLNLTEFERYLSHRDVLDAGFDEPVHFDSLPGKKACRIHVDRLHGDVLDADDRDEMLHWFISTMAKFRPATQQIRTVLGSTA